MSGSLIFGLDLVFISFKKAREDSDLYLSRSRSVPDSMYVRKLSLVRPSDHQILLVRRLARLLPSPRPWELVSVQTLMTRSSTSNRECHARVRVGVF